MADNLIEILIKFGLDKSKATEAASQIKEIQKASTEAGAAGVKAQAEVTEATKKTFASNKDLKEMVKQLGHEFPVLGSFGRLALNPIAAVTASITAAFLIWNKRVNDLTVSLGGIEMPDLKEGEIARIERVAAAYGKWAESVAKFKSSSDSIKSRMDAALKVAQFEDAINRAMGGSGTDPKAAEARAKNQAAAELEARGRALIGASGTPGSPESEAALGARYQAAAEAATKEKEAAQKRIDEINAIRSGEMNPAQQAVFAAKYAMRYGPNTLGPEALAMEQANVASQQGIIDRYTAFQAAAGSRAGRRQAIATGQAFLDQAAQLRGEAAGATASSVTERTGEASGKLNQAANDVMSALSGGGLAQFALAMSEFRKEMAVLPALAADVNATRALLRATASQLKSESRNP